MTDPIGEKALPNLFGSFINPLHSSYIILNINSLKE